MNQLPSPQENSPADFRNPSIDNIELPSVPEYSPADYRMKARPGEPQIVADPLPFAHQVCLYQRCIRTHVDGIKEIVSLKTDGGVRNCDEKEQEIIGDISIRSSQDEVHPWLWNNPFCFGKYIASGITQLKDLAQAIILTDEQFEAVKVGFDLPRVSLAWINRSDSVFFPMTMRDRLLSLSIKVRTREFWRTAPLSSNERS